MKALCVDDERIPLETLKRAVEGSNNISEVAAFENEEDALDWAASHHLDVAFLDIELHRMSGLELAQALIEIHPRLSVVFCTSHEQYAVKAIKMHIDAGYLVKPFRAVQVQDEIDHVIAKRVENRRLRVSCFGDFEAFVDDKPIDFRRRKTKELFAYLIDRRGSSVTTDQLIAALWEDDGEVEKKKDLLYHLVSDMRHTMEKNGLEDVLVSQQNGYAIDPRFVMCDYYRMLDGDEYARRLYTGEYMSQYSWAETTNSWIGREVGGE